VGAVLAIGVGNAAADRHAESSATKVRSKVTISGIQGNAVTGRVTARKRVCEKSRLVSLLRLSGGEAVEVDLEASDAAGSFVVEDEPLLSGTTYLVGVGKVTIKDIRPERKPKKTICKQSESKQFVP
jgi:hypothetical protein